MKRINCFKLVGIFILIFLCSGCVKFDGEVKIHNTKSMNLVITYAIDQDIIDSDVVTADEKNFLQNNGFKINDYKKDSYKGVTLKYKIKNIDKVSSKKENKFSITSIRNKKIDDIFKVNKSWFKNKYKANFIFDATDVGDLNNIEESDYLEYLCDDGSVISIKYDEEIPENCFGVSKAEIENAKSDNPLSDEELNKKFSKDIDLKFSVKLPNKVISNNADEVSKNNKKLTWKLSENGITNIEFEFELYNYIHILITILGVLLIIFVLVILIVFLKRRISRLGKRRRRR